MGPDEVLDEVIEMFGLVGGGAVVLDGVDEDEAEQDDHEDGVADGPAEFHGVAEEYFDFSLQEQAELAPE